MIPCTFQGFLNDSGHSVYVGDLSLERGALDASRLVGGFGDPEIGELDLPGLAEKDI